MRTHLLRKTVHFVVGRADLKLRTKYSNVEQTDTFESFVTKKVYKINHSFNCDSKCLIHLFHARFVVFSMSTPQLIDSNSGGTTEKVVKGMQKMGEHPTKSISINIF